MRQVRRICKLVAFILTFYDKSIENCKKVCIFSPSSPYAITMSSSTDVNAYIKRLKGDDYSVKDFRTWGGTLLASTELGAIKRARDERQLKKIVNGYMRNVAEQLGNTPAVTRSSYIDPRVITAYETGDSLSKVYGTIATMRPRKYLKPEERCLLKLLSRP